MNQLPRNKLIRFFGVVLCMAFLSSCAKVGSERWCENLKEKPKGEWSVSDAENYMKHCVKF